MKRIYVSPLIEKVEFRYNEQVLASGSQFNCWTYTWNTTNSATTSTCCNVTQVGNTSTGG